jgi:hypothetical protein
LLCIGGPQDGEILSVLELPLGAVITINGVRRDQYVGAKRQGREVREVWLWQGLEQ